MGARVLIVGGGGREHALAFRLARSPQRLELVCAPGNPGIAEHARCVATGAEDVPGLLALARAERPELVIVGPEAPLCAGLVDALADEKIAAFGPRRAAAELEGSKAFTKALLSRTGIPTAPFGVADDFAEAERYIDAHPGPLVVKADGLAAGKGVIVCVDSAQARAAARSLLVDRALGAAGARLVLEERLRGHEASLLAFVDGERVALLPAAEDHKPVFDDDEGPNTGGMGAYSPTPRVDAPLLAWAREKVLLPIVRAMAAMGRPYQGVLYAGLMLTPDRGPMVLEFNCRFGDPETQVLMARFAGDLYPWLAGAAAGRLPDGEPPLDPRAAVCIVQCAGGYPGAYEKGREIVGLEQAAALPDVMVFQAGTARTADGRLRTAGGRVLGVTALGADVPSARKRAYEAVSHIQWEGEHHRSDIAARRS